MFKTLSELEEYCLDKVKSGQCENGEFKTFLFFPGKKENGWIYSGPSVFLTTSIAIALLSSDDEKVKSITGKAAQFVRSQMEAGGLWRFYPHNGLFKFNTPLDVDDTSLASFLLTKCGVDFPDNKKLLLKQIDKRGNFYVWFLPRFKYLSMPGFLLRLVADLRYSLPIFFAMKGRTDAPLINYNDFEHSVSSNAVLYLSNTKETQKSINHITEDILFGNEHNLYFYPSFLFTLFHISRAYRQGISDFSNLKEKVGNYFKSNREQVEKNLLNKAIGAITLLNFEIENHMVRELMYDILKSSEKEINTPYGYFCTKDRNMEGGSVEFNCAIIFYAIQLYRSSNIEK
ncbi:MAG: hypothetical protein WD048_09985 [Chitinophagales bacterium]